MTLFPGFKCILCICLRDGLGGIPSCSFTLVSIVPELRIITGKGAVRPIEGGLELAVAESGASERGFSKGMSDMQA